VADADNCVNMRLGIVDHIGQFGLVVSAVFIGSKKQLTHISNYEIYLAYALKIRVVQVEC
jgi:hypothetical protein